MTDKSKIVLSWNSSGWDCELCGWIQDETLTVTQDGVTVLELASDGHFGNGDDLDDTTSVLNAILKAVGSSSVYVEANTHLHRNDDIENTLKGLGYDVLTLVEDESDYDD